MSGQKKTTKVGEKKRRGRKIQSSCTICGSPKDGNNSGGYFRSYCKRCCALVGRIKNINKNKESYIKRMEIDLKFFKIYIKSFEKELSVPDMTKKFIGFNPRHIIGSSTFQCRYCGVGLRKAVPLGRGRKPNICPKCQDVQRTFVRKVKNVRLTQEVCKEKITYLEKSIKFADFVLNKSPEQDLKKMVQHGIKMGIGE